ncbi:3-keto-5-aminohexanoate cleavage protein [Kiloniella antarctica]|uniref:3-keto-5-aminohexanoate cleavage protein n=1 Tax=Kiloniella antarctica TaxID=1550907 RepID=A0ABW5BKR4_9PROT
MTPTIIMAAPNGARKTRTDHPNLPVTVEQIIEEALACQGAGAAMAHLHVRDQSQAHVLDAGLYREVLAGINATIGDDLLVQITTEAVGHYTPQEQVSCVKGVMPEAVSVALKEMMPAGEEAHGSNFYHWANEAGIHVQHILYDQDDLIRFLSFVENKKIPVNNPSLLFVLGRYASDSLGKVDELSLFIQLKDRQKTTELGPWFVCAFGHSEANCIAEAIKQGGHARVGFENNSYLRTGNEAGSTSQIITQTRDEILNMGKAVASAHEARKLLGIAKKS